MKLLIKLSLDDRLCKSTILPQLIPAIQKLGENLAPGTKAELMNIDLDMPSNSTTTPNTENTQIEIGNIKINLKDRSVKINNVEISLTPIEYKLMTFLAIKKGNVQTRANLLKEVWNINPENNTRTLDVHIKRIRDKLGASNNIIQTVPGIGYIIK